MPYRSDVQRITQALNWIGVGALVGGIAVVVWALWWTRGVDDFRTAVIVAALGFGLPSLVALAVAWLLDPLADATALPAAETVSTPLEASGPAPPRRGFGRAWSRPLRYLVAVGIVIAAALVRQWIDPLLGDRAPFITFFLAVALSAWIGGFGVSALATALCTVVAWRWFMRGPPNLPPDLLTNVVSAGLFVASALAIGGLVSAMRATAQAADRMSAETKRRNAELQTVEDELERERERMRGDSHTGTMLDGAPVLIWMADASGAREHFNRRWLEFTGLAPEQAVGLQWADAVQPDDRERCLEACRAALEARAPYRVRYRLRRFDGEYRLVAEEAMPRIAADGAFAGYVGACMDIEDERGATAPPGTAPQGANRHA
jgi:PAS domain S-box-containing protein